MDALQDITLMDTMFVVFVACILATMMGFRALFRAHGNWRAATGLDEYDGWGHEPIRYYRWLLFVQICHAIFPLCLTLATSVVLFDFVYELFGYGWRIVFFIVGFMFYILHFIFADRAEAINFDQKDQGQKAKNELAREKLHNSEGG